MTYKSYVNSMMYVNNMLNNMIKHMEEHNYTGNPVYEKLCAIRQLEAEIDDMEAETPVDDDGPGIIDFVQLICDKEAVPPKDSVPLSSEAWDAHVMMAITQMREAYRLTGHLQSLSYHTRTLENDLNTWLNGNVSIPLMERWIKDIQNADKGIQIERMDMMETIAKHDPSVRTCTLPDTIKMADQLVSASEFKEQELAKASNHLVMAESLLRTNLALLKATQRSTSKMEGNAHVQS